MTRYVISGLLGRGDGFRPAEDECTQVTSINLLDDAGRLRFGLDDALSQLAGLRLRASAVGIDLLILAALVYAADTRLNRVRTSQDAWTREIELVVPVSRPELWGGASGVLERMLRFLTGDRWTIRFRPLPETGRLDLARRRRRTILRRFDGVSLFSGGLDSLIGAIDELSEGCNPLFVSHGGEGGVSGPQRRLFNALVQRKLSAVDPIRLRLGLGFPNGLIDGVGSENSTRGRSFLFIAAAAFAGSAFERPFDLRVPENGFISLNVPLDVTRLGSNSTRTTHPFYMHRWNELLSLIGIRGTVSNRYWNRTKGEMVSECADQAALEDLAPASLSCAHPSMKRWQEGDKPHCGYCLPCLIRRGALMAARWSSPKDRTGYSVEDLTSEILDTTKAKGRQVRGFQYAIAKLNEHPELAATLIYKPGPLKEDAAIVPELARVYSQGMKEVETVLEGVVSKPIRIAG
ncbi:Qat anti-phage system QueC-like protein QatC [Xanthobacter agilis]|uniref:Qat anti-phage system QueC-like protein QatC n=1 Tax=Xanthobacter agilis TaxID=47492 RepID=UPI003728E084